MTTSLPARHTTCLPPEPGDPGIWLLPAVATPERGAAIGPCCFMLLPWEVSRKCPSRCYRWEVSIREPGGERRLVSKYRQPLMTAGPVSITFSLAPSRQIYARTTAGAGGQPPKPHLWDLM